METENIFEFKSEDYNWTNELVMGMALELMGGEIDSNGMPIKGMTFYEVGKHKENGKVVIMPTDKTMV